MPKPTDGVPRPVADRVQTRPRRRSTLHGVNRKSVAFARATQDALHHRTGSIAAAIAGAVRRGVRPFASTDRALPILVATIVAVASLLAVLPTVSGDAVGRTQGSGQDVRIAVNGGFDRFANQYEQRPDDIDGQYAGEVGTFRPVVLPGDVANQPGTEQASADPGNFLDDGTLVTGYAPATDVTDGADLIVRYKVKTGDTLNGIANHFGVGPMTVWWANKLNNKDELHVGQMLRIPPVSGLVVTVKDTDTLDSLAAEYDVKPARVLELNGLDDPTLVVGQVLVLPGAQGRPDPDAQAHAQARAAADVLRRRRTPAAAAAVEHGGGHVSRGGPSSYNGGQFHWPVVGGGNYISQYFHSGHTAIDIAADYGSPVVAAAGGRVVFAGWKSNGGGWQVWMSHGSGIYTTYNHMSSLSVGTGQSVGRGDRVGRIGQTGGRPARTSTSRCGSASLGRRVPGQPDALLLGADRRLDPGPRRARATIATMFLDDVRIFVRAGAGGDGASTMRREAHVPRGGPDGGDGGRGGSVYLRVDAGQTALHDFRYKHHFVAGAGGRGERQKRHGKAGDDLFLPVPPGTAVIDLATGGLIADLVAVGQEVMVAKGGRGGLGNTHFATRRTRRPSTPSAASRARRLELRLELRLIADVGLVGLPNAGKSTLLAALTAATPRIADYPFTTLEPNLGVLDLGLEDGRRPTIADVPGLIEGASSGAGLGHAFLRHVERTRVAAPHRRRGGPRRRAGPRGDPRRARGARPGAPRARPS